MLSETDNHFATRVGRGMPMGDLMRRFWIPVAASFEVTPDGAPLRVRVLGEDLIAFRETNGRVGVLGTLCPHRGAPLFFGRNEEGGLRCVYHGWKFDVDGKCMEMPNESSEGDFKHKVRHLSYPCRERGGIVFAYMAGEGPLPPLPGFEFLAVPETHSMVMKRYQEANWLQFLEGDIDSSHGLFLHSAMSPENRSAVYAPQDRNSPPRFEVVDTGYGIMIAARRDRGDGKQYWRINQFLMPFWTMPPSIAGVDAAYVVQAWVPIDDENCMRYRIEWHPTRPLNEKERRHFEVFQTQDEFGPENPARPGSQWLSRMNKSNDYEIDRARQKRWNYTGMGDSAVLQDLAVQEGMGRIVDRTVEHLGPSDLGIIKARRRLLASAKALRDQGTEPQEVSRPEVFMVRAGTALLPSGANWLEDMRKVYVAVPGVNAPKP